MNIKTELSHLELTILDDILEGKIEGTYKAMIAWIKDGRLEFGPCRWAYKNNYHTNDGKFDSWSASPFPGAWSIIPITQIVRVRHFEAI
jgi:hypothetical protein